ncbi:polysaccharide biosynthesis tyrosine autokinase [Stieleria varia]|uniref:non-specific protein-tyrosine kinase n=1 Tax=Stieleria varia TaxID=2528005 RepID=A0A5C6B6G8_9BACT|nr:polysaccharide biosynthesis tyrosine autokinase [Stieleria varia]TWU07548.1 putative tyrosine-protein kinase in cps region [Stieleria varia]
MAPTNSQNPNNNPRRRSAKTTSENADSLDVLETITRQRWLLAFFAMLGLVVGVAYSLNAQIWYKSNAKVLIAEKTAGLGEGSATGQGMVEEDTLANHMELIASRMIVGDALQETQVPGQDYSLMELPSIKAQLSDTEDAIDYVIDHLELVKGGEGSAKTARSLNVSFKHTEPDDAQLVLTAVMKRYEQFIIDQVEQVMGRANELVQTAKSEVEAELNAAEQEHLASRKAAPLFFQGTGSSNVYQDRYRRLQEELLDLDIKESTLRTRMERVQATLEDMDTSTDPVDHLDKLALIDSESLERLGLFAGLQMNSSNTAEFKAAMPAKMEEARTQITGLLRLNSEKQRLTAVFGPGHPKVQELENEIQLVKQFLQDNEELTNVSTGFSDTMLTPESLLKAYIGFVNHDIAALGERRKELIFLSEDAETKAKELIDYELQDMVMLKKIDRQEALFEGVVSQLRDLDTASGLSGYLYEFLELPRIGRKVWPSLPICGLGGLMLGLATGVFLAFANEIRDGRFRTAAELDEAIGLPSLGRVGKLNSIDMGIRGLVSAELSPDAEAFRLGRTVLLPEIRSGKLQTIGFTSPMQGDGKSTVTSNFAVSFAQLGLKTVVVDADLRRPSIHRYFSVSKTGGLCDVLEGRLQLADVIKDTDAEKVSVITAGSSSKMPAELLQMEKLDELLEELKQQFDVVLVDLPPVLAVSDPVVVMPRLDGGVLVIRVARVRRDEVINTMRRIRSSGGNFVGCMLNALGAGANFDGAGGYYGYYRSDYTRKKKNGRAEAARPIGSLPAAAKTENESDA